MYRKFVSSKEKQEIVHSFIIYNEDDYMSLKIRTGKLEDVELICELVMNLLSELRGKPLRADNLISVSKELLQNKRQPYMVYLAFEEDKCLGIITLSECASLYAQGLYGIIQELYIIPSARSQGIGNQLINKAKEYGIKCGWDRIELGAPNAEKWSNTISFYKREGFKELGPRLRYHLN